MIKPTKYIAEMGWIVLDKKTNKLVDPIYLEYLNDSFVNINEIVKDEECNQREQERKEELKRWLKKNYYSENEYSESIKIIKKIDEVFKDG